MLTKRPHGHTLCSLCVGCSRKTSCAFSQAGPDATPFTSVIIRAYPPGQAIIREGEPNTRLHLICKGLVMVTRLEERGEETLCELTGTGSILGLSDCLLERPTYSVAATTLGDTTIIFISPEEFHRRLENEASFSRMLLKQIGEQFHLLEEQAFLRNSYDVRNRVLLALIRLCELCGQESSRGTLIPIRLRRPLLAQLAGTTPETVSRVMMQIRKSRLIQLTNHKIIIPNMQRLRDTLRL